MRIGKGFRALGVTVAALAAVGLAYQPLATALEARKYPAPGRLIDVGGHRLHIQCQGFGSPTIVLEAGLGGSSLDWSLVTPDLSRTARVCVYDRAGYGWSDAGPLPRTSERSAEELHSLLIRAGEPGPYVLAAHSLGGLHAQVFAARYPQETAGLVLIDPTSGEAAPPAARAVVGSRMAGMLSRGVPVLARFSLHRALWALGALPGELGGSAEKLPAAERSKYRAVSSSTKFFTTLHHESAAIAESLKQAQAARLPAGLPQAVVRPEHEQAEKSGDYIHVKNPAKVLEAIRSVHQAARRGARGAGQR